MSNNLPKLAPITTRIASTIALLASSVIVAEAAPNNERRGIATQPQLHADDVAGPTLPLPPGGINIRKSLMVTSKTTMSAITFSEVMEALARDAVATGLGKHVTKEDMFEKWWWQAANPYCSDQVNGYLYDCPRPEAEQLATIAFGSGIGSYFAIAAVNRLDITASDFSNCGEHRIIFARKDAPSSINRNMIIFEMNAKPAKGKTGIEGCVPYAKFWASLSNPTIDATQRGALLKDFYLNGIPSENIEPVISLKNLGFDPASPLGQIRTNQFLPDREGNREWLLREFRPRMTALGLQILPQPTSTNPAPILFGIMDGDKDDWRAEALAQSIIDNLSSLVVDDINRFSASIPDQLNTADSHSQIAAKGDYVSIFEKNQGNIVEKRVEAALIASGSQLKAINIVHRLRALSCGGCHRFSDKDKNLMLSENEMNNSNIWPAAASFVHVSEKQSEDVDGDDSFNISDALRRVFLPFRLDLMKMKFFKQ